MLFIPYPPPTPFEGIDDASAELILELQLADLEDLEETLSGKQREGDRRDGEIAASVYEENIRELQAFFADKRMTRSVAQAVAADGPAVTETILEESTAHDDRRMAWMMGGDGAGTHPSPTQTAPRDLDDAILAKLAATYISEDLGLRLDEGHNIASSNAEGEQSQAETSAWAAGRAGGTGGIHHRCVSCLEPKKFFDVIAAPCQDEYCRTCVRELFEASFSDESLFPPRCCRQPILLEDVELEGEVRGEGD